MGDDGVVVERRVEVAGDAEEAVLKVEDDEHGVGLVQARKWDG